jgi:hypothetical protein
MRFFVESDAKYGRLSGDRSANEFGNVFLKANPGLDDYIHVDAMILNIERVCQACIDLAMHLKYIAKKGWKDFVDFCKELGLRIETP